MQKLVEESKEMGKKDSASIDHSSPTEDDTACEVTSTRSKQVLQKRRAGNRLTCDEDKYIRLGIENLVCVGQLVSVMENFISIHVVFQIH